MKADFPQAELRGADIERSMKSLCVLFAGNCTALAFEPLAGSESAFSRALSAASRMPDVERIAVFASGSTPSLPLSSKSYDLCVESSWSVASFFSRLAAESEGFDQVIVLWADCPFVDAAFTAELYRKHLRYAAEYSFADGYPYGLAPEILARGIVPILASLAKENGSPVSRDSIFSTIKKDINSFDIETDIAPTDLRQLRLEFTCDTKRNAALCAAFDGIDAANYAEMIAARGAALRTLPSFYAIQVSGKCPHACVYCPYPAFSASGKGRSPGVSATKRNDFMSVGDFSGIIDKIAAFSGDAVVSLSLWGECAFHPEIVRLVETVLSHPGLSILIETTGIGWKAADVAAIAKFAQLAVPRKNGQNSVNWIISLDAVSGACYGELHGLAPDSADTADVRLREALAFAESLTGSFPGAVWPQMVRVKENEAELESFYRFWKQKYGQVIILKHDHFCKNITDRRVADLSPLVRNPCWHLKRDMCILLDGTVPFCREDLYASRSCGNAIDGDLAAIWAENRTLYEQHLTSLHEGMCGSCDEYYTYNF
jgi:spiro-SPASM protein